jgi:hypothetical protein
MSLLIFGFLFIFGLLFILFKAAEGIEWEDWVFHVQAVMPMDYDQLMVFLRRHKNLKIVIDKEDFIVNAQARQEDGSVKTYIYLDVSSTLIWDEEEDRYYSLLQISGCHELHISLCYDKVFENYGRLHNRTLKARSFLAGLQGEDLWGAYRVSEGEQSSVLQILPTSQMYGLLSAINDYLDEAYPNFHITIRKRRLDAWGEQLLQWNCLQLIH